MRLVASVFIVHRISICHLLSFGQEFTYFSTCVRIDHKSRKEKTARLVIYNIIVHLRGREIDDMHPDHESHLLIAPRSMRCFKGRPLHGTQKPSWIITCHANGGNDVFFIKVGIHSRMQCSYMSRQLHKIQ